VVVLASGFLVGLVWIAVEHLCPDIAILIRLDIGRGSELRAIICSIPNSG
jgi:hypothetical protein